MFATDDLLSRMKAVNVEEFLLPLLIQLALIIAAARVFAALFRRIGQPAVVGEITAGLILGPSVLGRLFPALFEAVFHPALAGLSAAESDLMLSRVLTALSEVGLVLLLFLIGLEFDFSHLRWHGKSALAVSLSGIVVPFELGVGLGWWMHPLVAAEIPRLAFVLFMGIALSITAMPVLGRILLDLGIVRSRLATIAIAAAALEDAVGWILLATVAALASSLRAGGEGGIDPWLAARMLGLTVAFGLGMAFLARPLLVRFARLAMRSG
jgi:Kef-type K+ transport system membrane component KefB